CVLVHDMEGGREALRALGRNAGFGVRGLGAKGAGRGLPARVIPFECFHIASIGIDFMLGAIAYGACQVAVLATGREPEGYIAALKKQMTFAEAVLQGLGYDGVHFLIVDGSEQALWDLKPAATVKKAATFNLSTEKRTSLDFAF